MNRRGFLGSLLALAVAPKLAQAAVATPARPQLTLPVLEQAVERTVSDYGLTVGDIVMIEGYPRRHFVVTHEVTVANETVAVWPYVPGLDHQAVPIEWVTPALTGLTVWHGRVLYNQAEDSRLQAYMR